MTVGSHRQAPSNTLHLVCPALRPHSYPTPTPGTAIVAMPAEPKFIRDKLESLLRKCVVFPANGSPPCLAHMSIRTVTTEDTDEVGVINRCVDMSSRFGDETRKTRLQLVGQNIYIFYNLSPQLPVNLSMLSLMGGFTPSKLQNEKRLFWRGDVVAMKVLPQSSSFNFIVQPLDASMSDLDYLEYKLRESFNAGWPESDLRFDEDRWRAYVELYAGPSALLWGASKSYWGENASYKEQQYLSDLNELRVFVGRQPIPPHSYMKSFTDIPGAVYSGIASVLRIMMTVKVKGPPRFPQHLERIIFETCGLENPQTCMELVLVAKRVKEWLDPILIRTIYMSRDTDDKRNVITLLMRKLDNGKPIEYYAEHVKNVALFGLFLDLNTNEIKRIFSICRGITNLVINAAINDRNLFGRHQAWSHLRRLTINLYKHSSERDFGHPAFRNLTHLHLLDDDEDWADYTGWHNLVKLTHLALAGSGSPEKTLPLIKSLPKVQYVALAFYRVGEDYTYIRTVVDHRPYIRAAWGEQVVRFGAISALDWERGARGNGDFWDLVEKEIQSRLPVQDGATDKKKKKKKKKKTKRSLQDGLDV